MRYLGTKKVVCPACGIELDVPLYHVDGTNHYGMKFCHQCGASLFYESRLISLSKSFVDWLTDKFYFSYCDNNGCDTCAFHRDNNGLEKSCEELTGEERLSIIKRIVCPYIYCVDEEKMYQRLIKDTMHQVGCGLHWIHIWFEKDDEIAQRAFAKYRKWLREHGFEGGEPLGSLTAEDVMAIIDGQEE